MSRRQQSTGLYAGSPSRDILNICDTVQYYCGCTRRVLKRCQEGTLKKLVGDKSDTIALQIQKPVITSSLNIANIILTLGV